MRYGALILKELKYKIPMAFLCYVLFAIVFETGLARSYARSETMFVILSMATCAYLFGNQDEMELLITSKARLESIFLIRLSTTYLSIVLFPCIHLGIREQGIKPSLAVNCFLTTVLFCCVLGAFWRIMMPSPFPALIFSVACCTILLFPGIANPKLYMEYMAIAPFYSIQLSNEAYIHNRQMVGGYIIVLLIVSCFILHRKDKMQRRKLCLKQIIKQQ